MATRTPLAKISYGDGDITWKVVVFDEGEPMFEPEDLTDRQKCLLLGWALRDNVQRRQELQRASVDTATAVRSLVSIALTIQTTVCDRARDAKAMGHFD